jgi:hypothetical protein
LTQREDAERGEDIKHLDISSYRLDATLAVLAALRSLAQTGVLNE